MHDQPRQVLREIVRSYGLAILKDPRRSRALMMDLCGEFRGEINLVEMALREGVADELQSALPVMPRGFVIARLAQRLQDVYYLPNDAAQWAVETCAAVLESALETEASGRVLSSGVMATVHVRPWLSDDQAWEAIGQTPGNVVLPDSGELRINARVDDAAATELARDLAAAGTVHRLDLSYSPLADEGLSRLLDLKGLVALDLSRTRIGDESLKRIGESETLREVNLWGVETLSDDGVVALGRCKRLESLELGRCSTITDRGLRGLRQLPHLAHLGLAATGITDSGLRWVGEIPALRSLDLSATGITGRGLDAVTGLGDLASLDLSGCVNLRPEGLAPLRSVAGLTELQLGRCGLLTDQALAHLRPLVGLRTLNLEGLDFTDAGLLYLARMVVLASLDLSWTPITDQGVGRLRGLKGLQALSLAGTQVTDAGMVHLAALPDLTHLDLSSTSITDSGLRNLRSLASLVNLDLESTQIRDAGLVHLSAMPSLTRLFLGRTAISDVGLELLGRITKLREIDLTLCPGVTTDGIELLRREGVVVSL